MEGRYHRRTWTRWLTRCHGKPGAAAHVAEPPHTRLRPAALTVTKRSLRDDSGDCVGGGRSRLLDVARPARHAAKLRRNEPNTPSSMLITRTPLRISIGGGGTDLPSYYRRGGATVVSAAINKYIY